MGNEKLFPDEIIDNSQESNFSRHSVKSKAIYVTILLFIIGAFCALPFIYLDVGVRSHGFIRPSANIAQITAPVSGFIQSINATENSLVKRGDIIAVLSSPEIIEKIRFNEQRQNQLDTFIADLEILQKSDSLSITSSLKLNSLRYSQAWNEFRQQLIIHTQKIHQLNREVEREEILLERKAISKTDFDETVFNRDSAMNNYSLMVEQNKNQWRIDITSFVNELEKLRSEQLQLREVLNQYEIRSPVTGTLQNTNAVFPNGFVYANQILGEISPDTSIVAEVYVTPKDIGLLHEGMLVRIQLDAYNQNQWGVATGKIEEISRDMIINNGEPLFRVRCSVNQDYLELKNGFKGEIKKGMSLQARFIVANRSLFQLLHDRVDDWLNPVWSENTYTSQ